MILLSIGGIILVDVQSISKEIDCDLLKIETEVESLEDYATEIRKLKTMSISEAIVAIKEINFNEFFFELSSSVQIRLSRCPKSSIDKGSKSRR